MAILSVKCAIKGCKSERSIPILISSPHDSAITVVTELKSLGWIRQRDGYFTCPNCQEAMKLKPRRVPRIRKRMEVTFQCVYCETRRYTILTPPFTSRSRAAERLWPNHNFINLEQMFGATAEWSVDEFEKAIVEIIEMMNEQYPEIFPELKHGLEVCYAH